jgi:hypothetical protein
MTQPSYIAGNFSNAPFKNRTAGHNHVGTGGHNAPNGVLRDAPVNLNIKR